MKNKLTGIDVFEIALAFNPVNKKKFFTVKDGATKPPVTEPVATNKDEPVTPAAPVTEPVKEPVAPIQAAPATPAVPVEDPPAPVAPVTEPATKDEPVTPAVPVAPVVEPVAKDDPLKTFKDNMKRQGEAITSLTEKVESICTALKDASMLPATGPDTKDTSVKDGEIKNSAFLPGSNS